MKKYFNPFLLLFIFTLQSHVVFSQKTLSLSGYIKDYSNKSAIPYSTLYDSAHQISTTADSNGFYKLSLTQGSYVFEVSSVGYQSMKKKITLYENVISNIELLPDLTLSEVTVSSQRILNTAESNSSGTTTLSSISVKKLPSFFGEKDIMRAVLLTSGVQSGQEGARGIFVRGGSPDQNLMMYHKAPIFNASHIYGFLSVFPIEAISKMDIYKSFIPSKFSGRLSSVLDIQPNYSNTESWKGDYSISFITQKFHIEGPLKKDKTSFNLSLRDCHAGAFVYPISKTQYKKASGNEGNISYFFYDINSAIQHKMNDNNTLNWSLYSGSDFYNFTELKRTKNIPRDRQIDKRLSKKLSWMNTNTSLEWQHKKKNIEIDASYHLSIYQLNPFQKLNKTTTVISTGKSTLENADYKTLSRIVENGLDASFKHTFKKIHQLEYGVNMAHRFFIINKITQTNRNADNSIINQNVHKNDNVNAIDGFLYADYILDYKDILRLKTGIQLYSYSDLKKYFFYPQPRMEAIVHPHPDIDIRLSFMQTIQPLHLLTNNTGDIQNDVWVPATKNIPPETAWQASGGIQYNSPKGYTASIDGFYKQMSRMTEYKYGTFFLLDNLKWDEQLLNTGTGKAYGLELFAAKTKGQFTAWCKYSLGWSTRQFPELNNGNSYFYKYDRRHDFSIVLQYKMKKHFDFTIAWTYGTGWRITSPQAQYATEYSNFLVDEANQPLTGWQGMSTYWNPKNDYVMPAYHHLDIGMNYTKTGKRCIHQFNVSVYNVYNNFNIFTIYSDYDTDANGNDYIKYTQLSMFPVLPSLGYTINFNLSSKKKTNEIK